MVPITEEWVRELLRAGEALNTTALCHNLDVLKITCEPEFGYIHIEGSQVEESTKDTNVTEVFRATQWRDLEPTIKIAPQVAATTTGADSLGGL